MNRASVQGAIVRAVKKAGITKKLSVHTLRHAYATHLLEQRVNIRVIQRYMGHRSLETTMRYLHLTRKGQEDAYQIIDSGLWRDSPMTVREVCLAHGKEYLQAFSQRMPAHLKKVIQAIIQCRTPELGTIVCTG